MAEKKSSIEKEVANLKKDFDSIKDLIMFHDAFWTHMNAEEGGFPRELTSLRSCIPVVEKEMSRLNLERLRDCIQKKRGALTDIYKLLTNIIGNEGANFNKSFKELIHRIKNFEFEWDIKTKKDALKAAESAGVKHTQAQLHYELGMVYLKKDANKFGKEYLDHFNKAIDIGGDEEIKAYALAERALHFISTDPKKKEQAINDLKISCDTLDKSKESKDATIITARARIYYQYGHICRERKQHQEAITQLEKALQLRPDHDRTIDALFASYGDLKPYENALEYIRDVDFQLASLPHVDRYLSKVGFTSLWLEAAGYGDLTLMESLEKSSIKKEGLDPEGNNALHCAAKEGCDSLIPLLTRYHSRDSLNKQGLTPLFTAALQGRASTVMALIHGSSPAIRQNDDVKDILTLVLLNNHTLVFDALREDRVLYEKVLIDIGKVYYKSEEKDLKETNEAREQLKKIAVGQLYRNALDAKSESMLALLIKNHPEGVNALYKGDSSFHYAVKFGYEVAVRSLVENGGEIDSVNQEKETALQLAKRFQPKIFTFLENEKKKRSDEQEMVKLRRKKFVESVMEKFFKRAETKKDMFGQISSSDSRKKFLEGLTTVVSYSKFSDLFQGELFSKLNILESLLVDTLVERFEKRDPELTRTTAIKRDLTFSFKGVIKVVTVVFESPWKGQLKAEAPNVVRLDAKREVEIAKIKPKQKAFCDRFEKQFDNAFMYFSAVANGDALLSHNAEGKYKDEGSKLSSNVSLRQSIAIPPGKIIAGEVDFFAYLRRKFTKKEIEKVTNAFKNLLPSERIQFIRNTAEIIYYKYENQIDHLMARTQNSIIPGAVEQFSDCVVARLITVLIGDNEVTKNINLFSDAMKKVAVLSPTSSTFFRQSMEQKLYARFIVGIIEAGSEYSKDKIRLETTPELTVSDNWTAKGIFENTGVLVEQNEKPPLRYAHINVQVNHYGYCRGILEEALARNLTAGPQKDHVWGEGRVWQGLGGVKNDPILVAFGDRKAEAEAQAQVVKVAPGAAAAATPK